MKSLPAEMRLHFDLLLLVGDVFQLLNQHLVAIRKHADLQRNKQQQSFFFPTQCMSPLVDRDPSVQTKRMEM